MRYTGNWDLTSVWRLSWVDKWPIVATVRLAEHRRSPDKGTTRPACRVLGSAPRHLLGAAGRSNRAFSGNWPSLPLADRLGGPHDQRWGRAVDT